MISLLCRCKSKTGSCSFSYSSLSDRLWLVFPTGTCSVSYLDRVSTNNGPHFGGQALPSAVETNGLLAGVKVYYYYYYFSSRCLNHRRPIAHSRPAPDLLGGLAGWRVSPSPVWALWPDFSPRVPLFSCSQVIIASNWLWRALPNVFATLT